MAAAAAASWPRRAGSLLPLVLAAFTIGALIVVGAARIPTTTGITTYAGLSRSAYLADLAAGLALIAAAAVALLGEATTVLGRLAFAAAIVWFAQDWEGWHGGPALVRSLAALAVPLLVVPPALLAAGVRSRTVRAGSLLLLCSSVVRSLVRDPLFDPHCWRDCVSRSFVWHSSPGLARALDHVLLATTLALGGAVVLLAVRQFVVATWPARRTLAPVLAPATLACAAVAAYAGALLDRPLEDPSAALYSTLFYLRAGAFGVLGAGVVLAVVQRQRQRVAVSRLTEELGAVDDALADAFGDPTLQVAYWLPSDRRYVAADGQPVDPPTPAGGRAVTSIVRGGRPVALVSHDGSARPELGSAARLALENERLQAEVRAQLEALRRSRTRVTERADDERRRLERDLHDGAQQRLLALSFDLRLARASADGPVAASLDEATREAQAALDELRRLAHGIYPAILPEAGIGPAVATLADEAPLVVECSAPDRRFDASVEAALYVAVREVVDEAARRGATWVNVTLEGTARLTVEDDGEARRAPLVHVADRIGALGGETTFEPNRLIVEIACE